MGEIADMHIEAYQAGLDPNEMDGADWADFYDSQEPLTISDMIDGLGCSARMLLCELDDMDGEDRAITQEVRAETLETYIPALGADKARLLVALLQELSDAANAESDRLQETPHD